MNISVFSKSKNAIDVVFTDSKMIIILEDGKIIEQGAHNQLLIKEGYYAALYLKQLSEKELL